MILMGENPFRGPLEVVHENRDFFLGPEVATSEASSIWAQILYTELEFLKSLWGLGTEEE
jgi:hypothetical protein